MTMKASRGSPAVPASTASLDGSYSSTLTNLADSLRPRSLRTVSTAAAISSAVKGASGLPTPTSSLCFRTIASTLRDTPLGLGWGLAHACSRARVERTCPCGSTFWPDRPPSARSSSWCTHSCRPVVHSLSSRAPLRLAVKGLLVPPDLQHTVFRPIEAVEHDRDVVLVDQFDLARLPMLLDQTA